MAKCSKPYADGNFLKVFLIKAAEIICPIIVKSLAAERFTHVAKNISDRIKTKSQSFRRFFYCVTFGVQIIKSFPRFIIKLKKYIEKMI